MIRASRILWSLGVSLGVGLAGAASAQPSLTVRDDQLIYKSRTPPPDECAPRELEPTGAAKTAPRPASKAAAAGATEPEREYSLKLSPACQQKLELERHTLTRDKTGAYFDAQGQQLKPVAVYAPSGTALPVDARITEQPPLVFVLDDHRVLIVDDLDQDADAVDPPAPPSVRPCTLAGIRAHDPDLAPRPEDVILAIEARGASVLQAPPRNVLRPNQGLVVYVCHDPSKPVTVELSGARGLTRAAITSDGESEAEGNGVRAPAPGAGAPHVARLTFAPRKPGSADLKVFEGTDTTGTPLLAVGFEVEQLYWGAVRFGLGTLFGDWKGYQIATHAGSRQPELRDASQTATFELVSGFSMFVFDFIGGKGGRSRSGGHNCYVAPYIGFGVLGTTPEQGLRGLSSFHAGLEFEVTENLAIAATFVYRRGTALAGGYDVGSPVAIGATVDNVTVDRWSPGFAIVVNATPAFLQFATGPALKSNGGAP